MMRKSSECNWCNRLPLNPGPVPILVGCTCVQTTGLFPCDSPRCPAADTDDTPIGTYRIVSNA